MLRAFGKRLAEAPFERGGRRFRAVVLCYHSVHPRHKVASVTPVRFEEQLAWLRGHCEVVALDDILAAARSRTASRPVVALTFDDGYTDNYEYAFPRLLAAGMMATFFLTVGFVRREPAVVRRMAQLWGLDEDVVQAMSWSQISEMQSQGMRFGSHTWSHGNLARADGANVRADLRRSKDTLEQQLGVTVDSLAYPFGKPGLHVTRRTVSCAAESGYSLGVQVVPRGVRRNENPLRIPRFGITDDSLAQMRAKIMGRLDGHGWFHEASPAWLTRRAFPGYDAYR